MLPIGNNTAESIHQTENYKQILMKLERRSRSITICFEIIKHEAVHSLTVAVFRKSHMSMGVDKIHV